MVSENGHPIRPLLLHESLKKMSPCLHAGSWHCISFSGWGCTSSSWLPDTDTPPLPPLPTHETSLTLIDELSLPINLVFPSHFLSVWYWTDWAIFSYHSSPWRVPNFSSLCWLCLTSLSSKRGLCLSVHDSSCSFRDSFDWQVITSWIMFW